MPDIVADGDNLGDHIATKSFKQIKGSDVASADAVTLGFGGNTFDITGTTTINHINNTNWVVGSVMILHFDGATTLTHNAGGLTGNEANILLSGDVDFTSSAGDALSFVLHDSTNWVEISRNVPSSSYTAPTLGSTVLTSGQTISTVAGLTLTNTTLNSSTNTVHADATQTYARNSSGSTITKGSPVYISGFDVGTTNPEISLADASASGTMPCIGLVSADIANNATGTVIASGQLTSLDTSAYTIGDTLYVSETTGTLTATKPTGTALIQNIAIVERVHSSFGVVHISAINRSNDLPNIPDGKLWIGNSSAVPTDVTLSGDVTVTNSGVTAIGAIKVTNAMLAGSIANTKLTTDPLDYANMTAPVASVAFNSQKLTGLADGVADSDAATKGQVDVAQAGLDSKYSCRVATTANVTLSGEQTIDGVLTSTDRVLVKDQTAGAENGIYVTGSGAWARSEDANTSVEVTSGLYTLITEGTASAGQGFVLVTADPITLDTTALSFSQFSGVGDLVGGTGITKTGNTIAIDTSVTADLSTTQTLVNKTLTAPTLDSYTDIDKITIPSDPASDKGRVYVKTIDSNNDGIFIKIKKAGSYVEVQIA